MQTFLPFPSFEASAAVLDTRRLGKQRVEVIQLLKALTVPGYAWKNHPATLMWEDHLEALAAYGTAMTREWCSRGNADTCEAQFPPLALLDAPPRSQGELAAARLLPPWLGDEALHLSHQSNLLRKDPEFYRPSFPDVPPDLPYVWPRRSPAVLAREARALERAERLAQRTAQEAEAL